MNPKLAKLQPYPFEKLRDLKAGIEPKFGDIRHIALSIGEPQHTAPKVAVDALMDNIELLTKYPATSGLHELRTAIAHWLYKRFNTKVEADKQIIPCNGTREGIFSLIQAVSNGCGSNVVIPNPFYQIYEGATILAGAKPLYLNCRSDNNWIPKYSLVSDHQWQNTDLLIICSPGNPSGTVHTLEDYKKILELADRFNFIVAADECYSEIYPSGNQAPLGILEACEKLGRGDYRRVITMHSLSKRSNLPGLRSGFFAGDHNIIKQLFKYRTYHGCAMSLPTQMASIAAWNDEEHVIENRQAYDRKYEEFIRILSPVMRIARPDASFYIWLKTPIDDEAFAQRLYATQNVTTLPGSYLSRSVDSHNPGSGYVRIALVAAPDECAEAAHRIRKFVESLDA